MSPSNGNGDFIIMIMLKIVRGGDHEMGLMSSQESS